VVLPSVRRTNGDRLAPTTTTEGPWRPPDGLTSWITPNDDFYRIDTALVVPRVDPTNWSMRIDGLVDRPLTFTLDDLLARDLVDATVTLSCVSNEVGGRLVGNAVWTGVPLIELLEEVGVRPDGEQVMGRSVDGFSAGFPRSVLDDARTALVAVGMNGDPLPFRHGFPARLVIAGLYGYVSAVKWLEQIELTPMSVDGYWIPRGWAKEAPVKIASRIDVPLRWQTVSGRQAVAGVAWAPVSGVEAVELAVDDGPWEECRLERGVGPGRDGESWVQWSTVWDPQPGVRKLRVRAWDRAGKVQPERPKHIAPDGAEGYHVRHIVVT
jgi:DMSO/TMAO reductase YedYZ molybdopterin-dependent catalytic subunit